MPKLKDIVDCVYIGTLTECEHRENAGELHGNGHRMTQNIVKATEDELKRRDTVTAVDVLKALDKASLETFAQLPQPLSSEMMQRIAVNVESTMAKRNLFDHGPVKVDQSLLSGLWRRLGRS